LRFKRRDTPRRSSPRFEPPSPATRIASASRGPAQVTPKRMMQGRILPGEMNGMDNDLAILEILLFPGFKEISRANEDSVSRLGLGLIGEMS
jgi:hypothetical protein